MKTNERTGLVTFRTRTRSCGASVPGPIGMRFRPQSFRLGLTNFRPKSRLPSRSATGNGVSGAQNAQRISRHHNGASGIWSNSDGSRSRSRSRLSAGIFFCDNSFDSSIAAIHCLPVAAPFAAVPAGDFRQSVEPLKLWVTV